MRDRPRDSASSRLRWCGRGFPTGRPRNNPAGRPAILHGLHTAAQPTATARPLNILLRQPPLDCARQHIWPAQRSHTCLPLISVPWTGPAGMAAEWRKGRGESAGVVRHCLLPCVSVAFVSETLPFLTDVQVQRHAALRDGPAASAGYVGGLADLSMAGWRRTSRESSSIVGSR